MKPIAYDTERFDPPAPVVPCQIGSPRSERIVTLYALVDTGADCSVIPVGVSRALGLPQVDVVSIAGVGGPAGSARVYAASVKIAGFTWLARVIALGEESIVGRDLLNRVVTKLYGPTLKLSFSRR